MGVCRHQAAISAGCRVHADWRGSALGRTFPGMDDSAADRNTELRVWVVASSVVVLTCQCRHADIVHASNSKVGGSVGVGGVRVGFGLMGGRLQVKSCHQCRRLQEVLKIIREQMGERTSPMLRLARHTVCVNWGSLSWYLLMLCVAQDVELCSEVCQATWSLPCTWEAFGGSSKSDLYDV